MRKQIVSFSGLACLVSSTLCSEELRPHLKPDFKILFTDLLDHCLSIRTGFFKLHHLQLVEYHTKSLTYQHLTPVFYRYLTRKFQKYERNQNQNIASRLAKLAALFCGQLKRPSWHFNRLLIAGQKISILHPMFCHVIK